MAISEELEDLIVDDARVHAADNHLLPAPGEEQDLPVPGEPGGGGGGGGGDTVLIVDMSATYAVEAYISEGFTGEVSLGFRFNPDGTLSASVDGSWSSGFPWFGSARPARWQRFAPVDDSEAAQFEVRATFQSTQIFDPADSTLTGAIGSWQGLGVERSWVLTWDRGSAPTDLVYGRLTRLAERALVASEQIRVEAQRRVDEQQEVIRNAEKQQAQARTDALAADAAARRLRERAAQLAAACGPAGPHPAASGAGEATAGAGLVLTDVLGRSDDTSGELAEAFDAARGAGLTCERAYDALRR